MVMNLAWSTFFNPSIGEVEAGGSLSVQDQPRLQTRPCFKIKPNKRAGCGRHGFNPALRRQRQVSL